MVDNRFTCKTDESELLWVRFLVVKSWVCDDEFSQFPHLPFLRVSMTHQVLTWQEILDIKLIQERVWLEERMEGVREMFMQ